MIQIHAFKKKEKEGGEGRPQLGGQWKVPNLVANGKFQVRWPLKKHLIWWPMEGSNAWCPLECFLLGD
jgi:hypothetical protein